jgi:hypothetical protein
MSSNKRVAINANDYRTAGVQFGDDNEFKAFLKTIVSPATMLVMVDSYGDTCFSPGYGDLRNAMTDAISSVVSTTFMASQDLYEAQQALKAVITSDEAKQWWVVNGAGEFPATEIEFVRQSYDLLLTRALKLLALPAQEFSGEET